MPETNPRFNLTHLFHPLQQDLDIRRMEGVGELSTSPRQAHRGEPPPGILDGVWHGTPEDFKGERIYTGPVATDDLPECVQDRIRRRNNMIGPADILLQCVNETAMPDEGFTSSILLEAIWEEATPAEPECGFVLGEDGDYVLGEDGDRVEAECPVEESHYILGEDGDLIEGDGGFIFGE